MNIYKNDFINGNKDKVFFTLLTIFATPLFYGILSYGHKINLTNKEKKLYKYIENFSITILILLTYTIALLAISIPNTYGFNFLILFGYLLTGVIFFHIAYPNHWELFEQEEKNNKVNNINKLVWFKLFPVIINIIIFISADYYNIKLYNLFIANIALLALILITQKNSKSAFIFLTILSGPIFWFLNYFYIKRNKQEINKLENELTINLKSRFLYN